MIALDPLAPAEHVAHAEELASLIRHDLGNRFAAIRNASLYLRRRLEGSEASQSDPRIDQFLKLIDEEVVAASTLAAERLNLAHLFARRVRLVNPGDCVRAAIDLARLPQGASRPITTSIEPGTVECEPLELALAVRCLIENAYQTASSETRVTAKRRAERYRIEIADSGPGLGKVRVEQALTPLFTTKVGHAGLGLNVALRVARRYRGELILETDPSGCTVNLEISALDTPEAVEEWKL